MTTNQLTTLTAPATLDLRSLHAFKSIPIAVPVFAYKAIDQSNASKDGVIASDSARQAREELRQLGLRVLKIQLASERNAASWLSSVPNVFKRSWNHWVASFTSELATLLSVGVPLLEALDTLGLEHKGKAKSLVIRLRDDVASGISLSEAMSRQPEVFDELCVKLLEVGQNTGSMDDFLRQLSDFKRRSHEFKDRVFGALMYPGHALKVSGHALKVSRTVNRFDTANSLSKSSKMLVNFSSRTPQ